MPNGPNPLETMPLHYLKGLKLNVSKPLHMLNAPGN